MITEKDLKTLFTSDEIQNAIKELGVRINSDYGDDELFLICVLKGAVMFTVDSVISRGFSYNRDKTSVKRAGRTKTNSKTYLRNGDIGIDKHCTGIINA